jgi:hypothetical protein
MTSEDRMVAHDRTFYNHYFIQNNHDNCEVLHGLNELNRENFALYCGRRRGRRLDYGAGGEKPPAGRREALPTRWGYVVREDRLTLIPYTPDRLDGLALRFLDLAGVFRRLAEEHRREELKQLALHDKKAMEWLAKIESWADEAVRRSEMARVRNRGARRAKEIAESG